MWDRSNTCYRIGDSKGEFTFGIDCEHDDLVVDTDIRVGGKKKKTTENPAGIEAIVHIKSTTLENTFTVPEDAVITFDLFCLSGSALLR